MAPNAPTIVTIGVVVTVWLAGCTGPDQAGDYVPASSISKDGFAVNGGEIRNLQGQKVKIWGFVDHNNLYGDEDAKAILGDWWGGDGPDDSTWRFNLKANADDAAGHSFAITVPNDAGRDEILLRFAADARAQRPTRVFVKGTLFTFDAPSNTGFHTGLSMELEASGDMLLDLPAEQ
jgi:hypothetical protein